WRSAATALRRAIYFRALSAWPHDLRFSGLLWRDSSKTLRCANDSFRYGPGLSGTVGSSNGTCRKGMFHRENLTLQSEPETLGLGESKKRNASTGRHSGGAAYRWNISSSSL